MTREQWGALQDDLCRTVGDNNYATWIKPLSFDGIEDEGVAVFHAPTNFFGTYVSQNFGDLLLAKLCGIDSDIRRVSFRVANARTTPVTPASDPEPARPTVASSPATSKDGLPGAPLDARFTFDTFVVGKPNELAHAAARRVAEGGPVTFNPLFLYGGVGLGKTHLMHAIGNQVAAKFPRASG